MLSNEKIDSIFDPRDGAMQGLGEMARRFARRVESAATAPLLARIAELEKLRSEDHAHAIDLAGEIERLTRELEEARKDAIPAMRAYAAKNPRFVSNEDVVQDPLGVHAWLEKHGAAIKEQT